MVIEGDRQQVNDIIGAFDGSRYLTISRYDNRKAAQEALTRGDIRALVVMQGNLAKDFTGQASAVQIITDASDPNIALFAAAYVQGIIATAHKIMLKTYTSAQTSDIIIEQVAWYILSGGLFEISSDILFPSVARLIFEKHRTGNDMGQHVAAAYYRCMHHELRRLVLQ